MNIYMDEPFLKVDPQIAARIGLNEALLLQRIHELSYDEHDPQWVGRSYKEWHDILPFWSFTTIVRTIRKLETGGYIRSKRINLGEKRYVVDYERCEADSVLLLPPEDEEAFCLHA